MVLETKELIKIYKEKKDEIRDKLDILSGVWNEKEERIFAELCFCLLTPQSKAEKCLEAITSLEKTGILFKGDENEIKSYLTGVRFKNKKARYIIKTRDYFFNGRKANFKEKIDPRDVNGSREFLVENIIGIGYKEASHFLRNIGLGYQLAILDRHILNNLNEYRVINEDLDKLNLTRKKYLEIEEKMRGFSNKINIPMAELDLLFWSMKTGKILK